MPQDMLPDVGSATNTAADDAVASFMQEFAPGHASEDDKNSAPPPAPAKPPVAAPAKKAAQAPKPTGTQEPKDATEDEEEDGDDGEESPKEKQELPEGYTPVPAVTEGLVTEFRVRDAEGELEVPDITIEYKANGRVRKDRLDQVVKLAQVGVYNVEREQHLAAREEVVKQEATAYKEQLNVREQQLEALLSDPDLYEAARERFMNANTPDRKVQQLQRQLAEKEAAMSRQQMAVQAQSFISEEVMPALEAIAEHCTEVSQQELSAQLAVAMYGLMENGIVPPRKYPLIRHYIVNQLTDWAEDTHNKRLQRVTQATSSAKTEAEKAKAETQQTKKAIGRAMKPAGRGSAAASQPSRKELSATSSVHDVVEDAVRDVLAAMPKG